MSAPESDERLFDQPDGWRSFHKDDRFQQRIRVAGGTFSSETIVTIRSSPAAIVALLREPWDWWVRGKIISSTRHGDGSLEMDFKPIWWYVARMSVRIYPPETAPGVPGTRLPLVYTGGLAGTGSIDVYADPSDPARSIVRSRCRGIRPHVRMLFANATTVGWGHLWAESGRMTLPFAKGTGYVGLIRRAEGCAHPHT